MFGLACFNALVVDLTRLEILHLEFVRFQIDFALLGLVESFHLSQRDLMYTELCFAR